MDLRVVYSSWSSETPTQFCHQDRNSLQPIWISPPLSSSLSCKVAFERDVVPGNYKGIWSFCFTTVKHGQWNSFLCPSLKLTIGEKISFDVFGNGIALIWNSLHIFLILVLYQWFGNYLYLGDLSLDIVLVLVCKLQIGLPKHLWLLRKASALRVCRRLERERGGQHLT